MADFEEFTIDVSKIEQTTGRRLPRAPSRMGSSAFANSNLIVVAIVRIGFRG